MVAAAYEHPPETILATRTTTPTSAPISLGNVVGVPTPFPASEYHSCSPVSYRQNFGAYFRTLCPSESLLKPSPLLPAVHLAALRAPL